MGGKLLLDAPRVRWNGLVRPSLVQSSHPAIKPDLSVLEGARGEEKIEARYGLWLPR